MRSPFILPLILILTVALTTGCGKDGASFEDDNPAASSTVLTSADEPVRTATSETSDVTADADRANRTESAKEIVDKQADVDKPRGFTVDVIAPHALFKDKLEAQFRYTFAGSDDGAIVSDLNDASTVIFADVTWEPGGTSGWHRHPGLAIVNIVEGELEARWKRDCTSRIYKAGDSFFDPGEIHNVDNRSDTEGAAAYVTFLGIPDGAPATEWVEPAEC